MYIEGKNSMKKFEIPLIFDDECIIIVTNRNVILFSNEET